MHNLTTFGDCAEILRSNGYAPAPLRKGERQPPGPWAAMQMQGDRSEHGASLVGVLTSCPAARGPESPVQNWAATRLCAVTVEVRDELVDDVDEFLLTRGGIVVRVGSKGERVYVFANPGAPFSMLQSQPRGAGTMRVNSAAHFLALIEDADGDAYEWPRGTLIDNRRDELSSLDSASASQLIKDFEKWASTHERPAPRPAPYVAKPMVEPGQRLKYGNLRARLALEKGGFYAAPVQFGTQQVPRGDADSWKRHDDHGVGLMLNPSGTGGAGKLTLVEISSRSAQVADQLAKLGFPDRTGEILPRVAAMIGEIYGAPCQRDANGTLRYVFRNDNGTFATFDKSVAGTAPGTALRVRIMTREGAAVISGDDANGKPLTWDVDWFAMNRKELPPLNEGLILGFLRDVDTAINSGETSALAKPRKRRKAKAA